MKKSLASALIIAYGSDWINPETSSTPKICNLEFLAAEFLKLFCAMLAKVKSSSRFSNVLLLIVKLLTALSCELSNSPHNFFTSSSSPLPFSIISLYFVEFSNDSSNLAPLSLKVLKMYCNTGALADITWIDFNIGIINVPLLGRFSVFEFALANCSLMFFKSTLISLSLSSKFRTLSILYKSRISDEANLEASEP